MLVVSIFSSIFVELYDNISHLSDHMLLCLSLAVFEYGANSKLWGWVLRSHGFPFSLRCRHRVWWLHPHEPWDFQFPQHKLQSWARGGSQSSGVSTCRFCTTSNSPASQASPEKRWELRQHRSVHRNQGFMRVRLKVSATSLSEY